MSLSSTDSSPLRTPAAPTLLLTSLLWGAIVSLIAFVAENFVPETHISILGVSLKGAAVRILIYSALASLLLAIYIAAVAKYIGGFHRFTSMIFGEVLKIRDDIGQSLSNLTAQVKDGIVSWGGIIYRTFKYDERRGIIYNRLEDKAGADVRNILFDARTVLVMFRSVKESDIEAGLTDYTNSSLFRMGLVAGQSFARRLRDNVDSADPDLTDDHFDPQDLYDWVRVWCEYDSAAGFGKFVVDNERQHWRHEPSIVLRHSFLTATPIALEPPKFRVCEFMTGYLQGVLRELPDGVLNGHGLSRQGLLVQHPDDADHCTFHSSDPERGCRFRIVNSG